MGNGGRGKKKPPRHECDGVGGGPSAFMRFLWRLGCLSHTVSGDLGSMALKTDSGVSQMVKSFATSGEMKDLRI